MFSLRSSLRILREMPIAHVDVILELVRTPRCLDHIVVDITMSCDVGIDHLFLVLRKLIIRSACFRVLS